MLWPMSLTKKNCMETQNQGWRKQWLDQSIICIWWNLLEMQFFPRISFSGGLFQRLHFVLHFAMCNAPVESTLWSRWVMNGRISSNVEFSLHLEWWSWWWSWLMRLPRYQRYITWWHDTILYFFVSGMINTEIQIWITKIIWLGN